MSGFDKAALEFEREGYEIRTCDNCKHSNKEKPCDGCEGPIGYWSPMKIETESPYRDDMEYAGDPDEPYDPGMDDR